MPDDGDTSLREQYARALAGHATTLTRRPCARSSFGADEGAECITARLPLAFRQPELGEIKVFAKRLPAPERAARQLWVLVGGPGIPSLTAEALAARLQGELDDVDVFLLDYRGVGRSSLLDCPDEPDVLPFDPRDGDWPERAGRCFAHAQAERGEELYHFNATETAMDLAFLVEALREDGMPVHLYAWSWGTHIAHAYLKVFPDSVDGVLLDSFLPPPPQADSDRGADEVLRMLLERCAQEQSCRERFEETPVQAAQGLMKRLSGGHCPELAAAGVDLEAFKLALGGAVSARAWWPIAVAALYRAQRCAPCDVEALTSFALPEASDLVLPVQLSPVVSLLQLLPFARAETASDVRARYDQRLAVLGQELRTAWIRQAVPAGMSDPLEQDWARPRMPVLMLQGDYDPITPLSGAERAAERWEGEAQRLRVARDQGHGLLRQMPCAVSVLADFLRAPEDTLDLGCLESASVEFEVDPRIARQAFGRDDAWEDEGGCQEF